MNLVTKIQNEFQQPRPTARDRMISGWKAREEGIGIGKWREGGEGKEVLRASAIFKKAVGQKVARKIWPTSRRNSSVVQKALK
jgi:hypothetical protein